MSKHMHPSSMSKEEKRAIRKAEKWEEKKKVVEQKLAIKQEKKTIKTNYRKNISTTKWIVFFLFVSCTAIEIFTGWVTWKSLQISAMLGTYTDFTPLVTLIGAIVGEVVGFAIYAIKAKAENTAGGVTYLKTQCELEHDFNIHNEEGSVG